MPEHPESDDPMRVMAGNRDAAPGKAATFSWRIHGTWLVAAVLLAAAAATRSCLESPARSTHSTTADQDPGKNPKGGKGATRPQRTSHGVIATVETPAQLRALADKPSIDSLLIDGSWVTNATLKRIGARTELRSLTLLGGADGDGCRIDASKAIGQSSTSEYQRHFCERIGTGESCNARA